MKKKIEFCVPAKEEVVEMSKELKGLICGYCGKRLDKYEDGERVLCDCYLGD